ncbi:MAG: ribosome recycling factor [Bacteroidales bacterium]|nr:ribosome recycling factor [Bacteroidales bacterium]
MEEELSLLFDDTKERMIAPLQHLEKDLSKLRAGKASPAMLETVQLEYYGTLTPLSQVANINTLDGKTLVVQPWEKSTIGAIEKAIFAANLGLTPVNDGVLIRISIPPLNEERRRDMVKQVKSEGENAKVIIRNSRRDANEELKKLKKDGLPEDMCKDAEAKIQTITDSNIVKVDEILKAKEADILTI